MSNRKKRPVQTASTTTITKSHLLMAANIASFVVLITVLVIMVTVRAPAQRAYEKLYKELESKGPDYSLVMDFYRTCRASQGRLGNRDCLKDTEYWAQRRSITTPVSIIVRDLREVEAKAFLTGRP